MEVGLRSFASKLTDAKPTQDGLSFIQPQARLHVLTRPFLNMQQTCRGGHLSRNRKCYRKITQHYRNNQCLLVYTPIQSRMRVLASQDRSATQPNSGLLNCIQTKQIARHLENRPYPSCTRDFSFQLSLAGVVTAVWGNASQVADECLTTSVS